MKPCRGCLRLLPLDEFYEDRRARDGRFSTCKACTLARARARKDANPELRRREVERTVRYRKTAAGRAARRREYLRSRDRVITRAAAWHRAHPDVRRRAVQNRRRRLGNMQIPGISRALIAEKVAYWGGRCWVCHEAWEQIDHVKPVAAGGANLLCNLRPICGTCNRSKAARWPFNVGRVLPLDRCLDALELIEPASLNTALIYARSAA